MVCFARAVLMVALLGGSNQADPVVEIVGPDQVEVRDLVFFDLKGLPAEFRPLFNWRVFGPADAIARDMADRQGNPVLVFQAKVAGKYEIIGDVNMPPDRFDMISHPFVVGSGPNPPPPPPPPPPPEPTAVFGIIIEERDDRDDIGIQRAMVMESLAVRKLFPAGAFQCRDDDVLDEGGKGPPPDVKPYIDRARKLGLPAIFLVNKNGKVLFEGPVPKDVPATVKLIGRYVQ